MSASHRPISRGLAVAALGTLALAAASCAKKPTEPMPSISGHVLLATGQSGDVSATQVQLYPGNPFAAGATPALIVTAAGSASDAVFTFSEVWHGDCYIVAWKDDGDGLVGAGDLRGWYDGAVNGTGQPQAIPLTMAHGQNATVNITIGPVTTPQPSPNASAPGAR